MSFLMRKSSSEIISDPRPILCIMWAMRVLEILARFFKNQMISTAFMAIMESAMMISKFVEFMNTHSCCSDAMRLLENSSLLRLQKLALI